MECSAQTGIPITQALHLRLRKHYQRGAKELKEPEDQNTCYKTVLSRHDKGTSSMKFQKYGFLNKICTISTPGSMPIETGEISETLPSPDKEDW